MRKIDNIFPGGGREGHFFSTTLEAALNFLKEEQLALVKMKGDPGTKPDDLVGQQRQIEQAEKWVKYLQDHPEEGAKPLSDKYIPES